MPELLAAEYPLRFMNMYGSREIAGISLIFDSIGVGHCAWAVYFTTRSLLCGSHMNDGKVDAETKPTIMRITSAEVLVMEREKENAANNSNGAAKV